MRAEKLASECVYYALFRVVELAELEDSDAAVKWAEEALAWEELRAGLVERVKERALDREPAGSAA
jgi:hypothetical protein